MADSNSFSALARTSKRGVSLTSGSNLTNELTPSMSIGAVDDYLIDSVPHEGRASSFGLVTPIQRDPFAELVRGSGDDTPINRDYPQSTPSSPFDGLSRDGVDVRQEQSARNDIHAIKVVTRLIEGISFNPGSKAPDGVKSATLRDQLVQVHLFAQQIAQAAEPDRLNRTWVIAQCSEAVAELIAHRSEQLGMNNRLKNAESSSPTNFNDVKDQVAAVCHVLQSAQTSSSVMQALDGLAQSRYVEATDSSIVRDRLSVSIASATWALHEKVLSSGFLYGLEPIQVIELLTAGMVSAAAESNISISSIDMRTAHLQGSIKRLSGLIAVEYLSKSQKVVQWIDDGILVGENDRSSRANESFKTEILPEILMNARRNFIAIEKIAPKLLEQASIEMASLNSRIRSEFPNGN